MDEDIHETSDTMEEEKHQPIGRYMALKPKSKGLEYEPCLRVLTRAQYTGMSYTRVCQLHFDVLADMDETLMLEGVPEVIQDLEEYSCDFAYDQERCIYVLKEVFSRMTNFEARRNQDVANNREDEYARYGSLFIKYGGVEVVMRLLMQCCLLPEETRNAEHEVNDVDVAGSASKASPKHSYHSPEKLRVKSVCLEILNRLISMKEGDKLAERLSEDDDLLNYTFTLLAYDQTFLTACQLVEDLLQSRKHVLNLTSIDNIRTLVTGLDDKKLSNFCRVLAVTISDLDIYENKSSLFAQNKQKRSKGFVNVRDVNQEMLLAIPDLIARLVNIAIAKVYTPRYPGFASELDCWMEWIENSMADEAFDAPTTDDLEDFIGGISAMSSSNGPLMKQSGLRISTDLILRVQVVYVLGLFLVGKHRKKVQRKLAELNLIPGLCDLFDQFIWKCQSHRNNSRHRLRGHNASCECSPEVALKIQFLRLVHSFCDHSDYKHLLLSKTELNEVKRINNKAGDLQVEGLDLVNKAMMCRGSKGLLTKVVEVMKKEPTASTFRFWLARAVESYLRGSSSYCDQIFLLRRGLLQHIAGNIVEHDIRPKEILQSSFDLLGEMVKFNVDAFKAFDKLLNSPEKVEKFLSTMQKNLVDSNMFIRALTLSVEHMDKEEIPNYCANDSMLLQHVSRFDIQMEYLQRLINLISVHNLTQENVSCLNTTLVMLMFARQKYQLPKYLQGLMHDWSAKTSSSSRATGALQCARGGDDKILKNFRDLLLFWQDHYLHKDKDCSALERSSRISFDFWKGTVNILVAEEPDNPQAIIHYLETDFNRDS